MLMMRFLVCFFFSKDPGGIQVKLAYMSNLTLECLGLVDKITIAQHFDQQGL